MSNVITQYLGTVYNLKPGARVGFFVGPMNTGEIVWATAYWSVFSSIAPESACMVVNLATLSNTEQTSNTSFEVVNTGQVEGHFSVFFAWTSLPNDFPPH
jgi:hypothetical protein